MRMPQLKNTKRIFHLVIPEKREEMNQYNFIDQHNAGFQLNRF